MSVQNKEESLDPESWREFKELGYRMIDDIVHSLRNDAGYKYVFPSKETVDGICQPLSEEGEGEQAAYEAFRRYIEPYSMGKWFIRSNFWGWVVGSGTPFGTLAQMLMAHMIGSGEAMGADVHVHKQTVNWIKEMLDFPSTAGGVIVNGGSEANFTGLAAARNAKAEVDMKVKGVQDVPRKMTCYVSDEGHHCLERSVELIGLGNENLRWVKTNDDYSVDMGSLRKAISDDRRAGCHPFCVIGNAGTVNTGAFDDFNALADLADRQDMWLHVDGAFGAWVKLSRTHRHLVDGMERADSLGVDLHKWMNMPYGIGCTIVRDPLTLYSAFVYGHDAEYLKTSQDLIGELGDKLDDATMLSLALSRGYSSLKAYMLLRAYGRGKYSRLVQQNLDQIKYFAGVLEEDPLFEVTAPVASNIVCFRYKPHGYSDSRIEELNKDIRDALWADHFGVVSDTVAKGVFSLRACNVSYRSRRKDFDLLVDKMKRIGAELVS